MTISSFRNVLRWLIRGYKKETASPYIDLPPQGIMGILSFAAPFSLVEPAPDSIFRPAP